MVQSRREHLVDTALRLFNREGYHATGIDRILAEAGVAKMTLYKHFKSKDELILATLRRRDEQFRNWFMRGVEKRAQDPVGRLLAPFDMLDDWIKGSDFWGCAFINAAAEYGGDDDPVHTACAEHKRLLNGYLRQLAEAAQVPDPEELAGQLNILMQGVIVNAQITRDSETAARAKRAAAALVRTALKID